MELLNGQINNWDEILQSVPAFTPLVEHIFQKEGLPLAPIENLTSGMNAVFKVGSYVIKIFAPVENGMNQPQDLQTELFAANWANEHGVPTPKPIASGFIGKKYCFAYIITEYVNGLALEEAINTMTDYEKTDIARKLRTITDKINIPCEPFNSTDVTSDKGRHPCWDKYPKRFKAERLAHIKSHDYGEKVFVHGDLDFDNILLTPLG